jgi:hypothetical protein
MKIETILMFTAGATIILYFFTKDRSSDSPAIRTHTNSNKEKQIPDKPVNFGYKIMWYAAKTNSKERLAEILELKDVGESNWSTGIEMAYSGFVFITPPIGEWTLVCGYGLPTADVEDPKEAKNLLLKLSREFGEAQYFGTHRVVEFHVWMKAKEGVLERVYSYLGESGINLAVEGEPTDFEKTLNLGNTFSEETKDPAYSERSDINWPNEEMVMQVAANWSIDPTTLEEKTDLEPGLGIIGMRGKY